MPKNLDYVHKSLSHSLELAEAIDYLGGTAKIQNAADRMKLKVSGSFTRLISAAVKHGLIENKRGELTTTKLFRDYRLAYNQQEKILLLRRAFLNVPIYQSAFDRFKGNELPSDMIDKVLIREFGIPEDMAIRVSGYFIDGGRLTELIVNNTVLNSNVSFNGAPLVELPSNDVDLDVIETPFKNEVRIDYSNNMGGLKPISIFVRGKELSFPVFDNMKQEDWDAIIKQLQNIKNFAK